MVTSKTKTALLVLGILESNPRGVMSTRMPKKQSHEGNWKN